jgi:hypothetical protein
LIALCAHKARQNPQEIQALATSNDGVHSNQTLFSGPDVGAPSGNVEAIPAELPGVALLGRRPAELHLDFAGSRLIWFSVCSINCSR